MLFFFQIDVLSNSSHLPLTLVFSSYEATNWIVKIPEGVSVAHVFLVSERYSSSISAMLVYGLKVICLY